MHLNLNCGPYCAREHSTFQYKTASMANKRSKHPTGADAVKVLKRIKQETAEQDDRTTRIEDLDTYSEKWVIRGTCTWMRAKRDFENVRGNGSVLSFELTDETKSIRVTAFNKETQKADGKVALGKTVTLSGGRVKKANKQFVPTDYEVTLNESSIITVDDSEEYCAAEAVLKHQSFTNIKDLESLEDGQKCNVLAVVHKVGPMEQITKKKTNTVGNIRRICVWDESGKVELTLWDEKSAELTKDQEEAHHILAISSVAKKTYLGEPVLSTTYDTILVLDPTFKDDAAENLKHKYAKNFK